MEQKSYGCIFFVSIITESWKQNWNDWSVKFCDVFHFNDNFLLEST